MRLDLQSCPEPESPAPDFEAGVAYWSALPPTLNTVLGGFASGSLPQVDAVSSRQLILSLFPHLRTFPSPHCPTSSPAPSPLSRALDVGAGIGRVASSVLLHIFTFVDLLEPVDSFLRTAIEASVDWKGVQNAQTGVRFLKAGLQSFDPYAPSRTAELLDQRGRIDEVAEGDYDLIWCQWCLGHLTDEELSAFLKRAKAALRKGGYIVVKENLCDDGPDGTPEKMFEQEDSSYTRSNQAWLVSFGQAGLEVVRDVVQQGFPTELFEVKSYVLR